MNMENTFAQKIILEMVKRKGRNCFQDNWADYYEESYGSDYNDCHGDYFDAD